MGIEVKAGLSGGQVVGKSEKWAKALTDGVCFLGVHVTSDSVGFRKMAPLEEHFSRNVGNDDGGIDLTDGNFRKVLDPDWIIPRSL